MKATPKGAVCRHGIHCIHGLHCWGVHTPEEKEVFKRQDRVVKKAERRTQEYWCVREGRETRVAAVRSAVEPAVGPTATEYRRSQSEAACLLSHAPTSALI